MKKSKVLGNSAANALSQVAVVLLSFITRTFFVKNIGIEYLGIYSTSVSILNALSVTELGLTSAIIYCLYRPLEEKDTRRINQYLSVYRVIYRCIGLFILCASFICLPFLDRIMKGTQITPYVAVCFEIQAFSVAVSYFISYKRTLLYADQCEYISKATDVVFNAAVSFLNILFMILCKSYLLYLFLLVVHAVGSNCFINHMVKKRYPYLAIVSFDRVICAELFGKVKNIFVNKVAMFIYSSTDNLLISALIGTTQVGYLSNYASVISSLKYLVSCLLESATPTIGHLAVDRNLLYEKEKKYRMLSQAAYILGSSLFLGVFFCSDDFISLWLGEAYIMPGYVKGLMAVDAFFYAMQVPSFIYINACGIFETEKKISIFCTICNIAVSLLLLRRAGLAGILTGTAVSQFFFWLLRSRCVFRSALEEKGVRGWLRYWRENLIRCLLLTGQTWFLLHLNRPSFCRNTAVEMGWNIFLILATFSVLYFITQSRSRAHREMTQWIRNCLKH